MNKQPRLFEPGKDLERIWLERAGPDLLAALRRIFEAVEKGEAFIPAAVKAQAGRAIEKAERGIE